MRIEYDECAQVVFFVFEIDTNDGMTLTSKTMAFKNAEGAWIMQSC
ncbi:hypothetical protein KBD08_00495 [Candidatus Babeliales bacterium]|nr:hypothetical protein [Candidatus Babeliales bacterium]